MPTSHAHSSTTLLAEQPRRKRSYHDFLHSDSPIYSPSPSPRRLRLSITPIPSDISEMPRASPLPPRRFVGDGFDYRRPVMSTNPIRQTARTPTPAPEVIDLTYDSDQSPTRRATHRISVERMIPRSQHSTRRHHDRPNQRGQDGRSATERQASRAPVVELEAMDFGAVASLSGSDEALMMNNEDILALLEEPPSSPGFEITGERTVLPDPPRRSIAERRATPYLAEEGGDASEPPPLPPPLFRNLPHGLASWIARAAGSHPGGDTAARREQNLSQGNFPLNEFTYPNSIYTPVPGFSAGSGWHPRPPVQLPRIPALDGFQRPRLNYEAQGFELLGVAPPSPPPRPSSPYKAPRAAAGGFTRKVEEDDIVVCPHCGDELGTGDDEVKQQIWVVKQCGHVYCGECALHRHVGKSKRPSGQAEGRPDPFKACVIPDCKKPVTSKTAFFQVYL